MKEYVGIFIFSLILLSATIGLSLFLTAFFIFEKTKESICQLLHLGIK